MIVFLMHRRGYSKGRSPERWIFHKREASIVPSIRGKLVTVEDAIVASYLTFDAVNRAGENNLLLPSTLHHTPLMINQEIKVDHPPALKLQPCPLIPHKGPPFDR
jgi:hypothetical protein